MVFIFEFESAVLFYRLLSENGVVISSQLLNLLLYRLMIREVICFSYIFFKEKSISVC